MSDETATPKHRSSPAPFIDLGKALERARQFYAEQRHHPAPAHVAVTLWGYGTKSSGGSQTIATLKQFGLMSDEGSGNDRRVVLTDLALRILRDTREPSPDRDALLRKAALMPKLHQELWQEYGHNLPATATVLYYLEVKRGGFTEQSARALISEYIATIAFARLDQSDTTEDIDQDEGEEVSQAQSVSLPPKGAPAVVPPPPPTTVFPIPITGKDFSVLFTGDRLQVSANVDQAGLKKLQKLLAMYDQMFEIIG